MTETTLQKILIALLRILLGCVFLYAGLWQIRLGFSAERFLSGAKTFPDFYKFFASPDMLPIVNVLVRWGHLLIGLALVSGIAVRLSSSFGAALAILYYFPRLEFPFVDAQHLDFIVEYHLVYAVLLVYLGSVHAGRYFGLADWAAELPVIRQSSVLRALVS